MKTQIQLLAETITVKAKQQKTSFIFDLIRWTYNCVLSAEFKDCYGGSVLVLVGAQGIGKSTWLQKINPKQPNEPALPGTCKIAEYDIHTSKKVIANNQLPYCITCNVMPKRKRHNWIVIEVEHINWELLNAIDRVALWEEVVKEYNALPF